MEPRVLYEARFELPGVWLLVLLVPVVFLFGAKQFVKKAKTTGKTDDKIGAGVAIFGAAVSLIVLVTTIVYQIGMYRATVAAYQKGNYQTVEGYVEDFEIHNDRWETFSVKGVDFMYGYAELRFGYHQSSQKGGVITGNGQHLKIGYTQFGRMGSVIVRIEELPEEGN